MLCVVVVGERKKEGKWCGRREEAVVVVVVGVMVGAGDRLTKPLFIPALVSSLHFVLPASSRRCRRLGL